MPLTLASAQRRNVAAPILIAIVVLAAIGGALFYFNPHHTADLTVTGTQIFAPVTEIKAPSVTVGGMHVVGQASSIESTLYVVVTVHLQNHLRLPLFLDGAEGKYIAPDNGELNALAPSPDDLERVEAAFPALKPLLPHPLVSGETVPPQSSVDGQVLLPFGRLSEAQWKARKPAPLTIHFRHQQPIPATVQ